MDTRAFEPQVQATRRRREIVAYNRNNAAYADLDPDLFDTSLRPENVSNFIFIHGILMFSWFCNVLDALQKAAQRRGMLVRTYIKNNHSRQQWAYGTYHGVSLPTV